MHTYEYMYLFLLSTQLSVKAKTTNVQMQTDINKAKGKWLIKYTCMYEEQKHFVAST